eukprot:c20537_g1_i1.p1 GENE.c20537_g1_i1~~c20537_g1_i1.p1  ORF type:complete len:124 (-),score=22.15 c20537_g1_i1:200-571(-)
MFGDVPPPHDVHQVHLRRVRMLGLLGVFVRVLEASPSQEDCNTFGFFGLCFSSTVATVQHSGNLEPVIYGSAGNLVTAAYDQGGRRAVFDGAFTRLFVNWDGPGTERYVINSACWLANVERHW